MNSNIGIMVKLLKLITGEELIAEVTEQENSLELKTAVRVLFTHEGVGMVPYALLAKSDKIVVGKNHVIFEAELDDEAKNAYNAQFGSGIVVSGANLKLVT